VLVAAVVLTGLVILASWGQMAWYSLRIASWYPLQKPVSDAVSRRWPKAAVLLPLRGADPLLIECLRGICRQDYANFELRLVLDDVNDEAWNAVRQAIAEFPQVAVHTEVLTERLETCSLKSSALLQAVRGLPTDVEIVAVIDADVIAPVWWLRELVQPFDDPQVCMSGGLRWFLPEESNCGSTIRRIWAPPRLLRCIH
jgi:cellulose synthase/poly-beta-1,6-N-acetylglucosamine synthase-like glycosyltransferase